MFPLLDLPDLETLARFQSRYPGLDVAALAAYLQLLRTAADVLTGLDGYLAGHGLSQRRFFVLILLARHPEGLPTSALAAGTGVTCATMTGVLDTLVRDGLVARHASDQDRRQVVVTATDKAADLLSAVLPGHYARVTATMGGLTGQELAELSRLLGKIAAGAAHVAAS